jgi:tetratricopeptide (TPR) repeat protein
MLKGLLGHLLRYPWRAARSSGTLREAFDALLKADDCEGALALAQAALARAPGSYEARLLTGRAHQKLHQPAQALEYFEAARQLCADDAELYDFRGSMFEELGRLPEAFADFDRALALRPDFPLAAFHRTQARILAGDFERGWDGYDLRLLGAGPIPGADGRRRWDGAPLAGRTIFVAREQGLGDEILFASILPDLIERAQHCIVECEPRLLALFRRSFPSATVFASPAGGGLPPGAAPVAPDYVIEFGSLPGFFRRKAGDFPPHRGYLHADPSLVEKWRERLAQLGPGLKVGLAWTGGVRKTRRALRSLALEQLLPILRVPGCRFVSLEYTAGASAAIQAFRASHGIEIAHWQEAIDDYDQTAGLACALDLVISVCTSVVDLCGALGRPAWVLAPISPEMRYGVAGESIPWYPSVRVFRQREYGQWEPVLASVAAALQMRASGSAEAGRRLGATLAMQERHAEAIDVLRDALRHEPRHADTANLMGLCHTLCHRYEEALAWYDAALEADPALADACANAGWTLRLLGRDEANRSFRRWLTIKTAGGQAYRVPAATPKVALPDVTLCCVDSAYHGLAALALRATLGGCAFGQALFLSDRDCGVEGARFVAIDRLSSLQEYSNFMIHRLHEHVETGHVLVIQYDGFVLHPQAWDPRFLDYDYIGPAVRLPDGSAGGIGGFSLRSRRLLQALRDDPEIRRYDARREAFAEDIAICCVFRRILESRHGIRFAPADLADRFAAEAIVPSTANFGFHNLMHLVCLLENGFRLPASARDALQISFRADTLLGPIAAQRELELRARGDVWARYLPPA